MWNKVEQFVKKHKLLDSNKLYLIALSGGADSVALLLLMHEAGYRIEAVHCNFRLRGEESDRDEQFCVELCQRLGVELHRAHFDTQTYSDLHKVSIEMAARELRYKWFAQLCKDLGAAGVCVAHHREDTVETVLLNLIRGTGLRGLTGIKPKSRTEGQCPCMILRPLLCVSREEIEGFLVKRAQNFVIDSTNLKDDVQRNKIRLQVLPLLRELNPAVFENIQRTTENLMQAQVLLDGIVRQYSYSNTLELNKLDMYCSSEYIVFEWLKQYGFNGSQAQQIMDAQTGAVFSSNKGYDVLKDRERLVVEPSLKSLKILTIPEEGTYIVDDIHRFSVRRVPVFVSKDPDLATVDADKVVFPLTVRRVGEGDWMIPYGMKGRKLLSDLMTDRKMSVFEKRRQLVVVDAQGIVVWLAGIRVDARVAVSSNTADVFALQLMDNGK